MQNGVYSIDSGAVDVEFKNDDRILNLPHVYVSHIAVNFGTAPVDPSKVSIAVVDASDFEIVVANLDVVGKAVLLYEFATRLPLARGDVVKIAYPNVDDGEIKIRLFHTYRI